MIVIVPERLFGTGTNCVGLLTFCVAASTSFSFAKIKYSFYLLVNVLLVGSCLVQLCFGELLVAACVMLALVMCHPLRSQGWVWAALGLLLIVL